MLNSINHINTIHLDHIIALASRLKLFIFSEVAYSIPIRHKRKQGRPAAAVSTLIRQPNETQPEADVDEYPSSSEETVATTATV
ncbi:hypothetical protein BpHYR1_037232 [Brachionus plicatilis]|uniref:Uncharacterized protein n=1 Tax=Brachionus plicatilis TaxID=10195 RepID=A0A3M7PRW9_BRAPC|nr:hypothetical protein BpHYR1_037232 [Brachionus plicatilis]